MNPMKNEETFVDNPTVVGADSKEMIEHMGSAIGWTDGKEVRTYRNSAGQKFNPQPSIEKSPLDDLLKIIEENKLKVAAIRKDAPLLIFNFPAIIETREVELDLITTSQAIRGVLDKAGMTDTQFMIMQGLESVTSFDPDKYLCPITPHCQCDYCRNKRKWAGEPNTATMQS